MRVKIELETLEIRNAPKMASAIFKFILTPPHSNTNHAPHHGVHEAAAFDDDKLLSRLASLLKHIPASTTLT